MARRYPDDIRGMGRRRPVLLRIVDRLSGLAAAGAALGMAVLALSVFADVAGRFALNAPLAGTLERTAYWWMPMLVLLSFAYAEREGEHIKVTILLDTLPDRMRRVVEALFGLVTAGLLLLLARHALVEATDAASIRQTTAGSPPVAIWPFKYLAPLGIGLMALQAIATALRHAAALARPHREGGPA